MAACHILDGERLTEAFGHVSARLPSGSVLITPRRAPGMVADPDELVTVELNGRVTDENAQDVPPEVHLHLAVYRHRPDVGAVCRFHPPAALALSTLAQPLRATVGYGAYLGGAIPLHLDPRLVRSTESGDAVAACLGDGAAVLLRGNGAATVGASVRQACVRAIFLEKTAHALVTAGGLGSPRHLDEDEVLAFAGLPDANTLQVERAWAYYVGKHHRTTIEQRLP